MFKLHRAGQVLKLSDAVVQIALKRSRGCSSSRSPKDSADPSSNLVVRLLQLNVCRIHKVLGNELVGHGSKQIKMSELVKKSRAKKLLLSRDMCLCEATVKGECLLKNPVDKNDSTKNVMNETERHFSKTLLKNPAKKIAFFQGCATVQIVVAFCHGCLTCY